MTDSSTQALWQRIAEALERISPPPAPVQDILHARAYHWIARNSQLLPVERLDAPSLELLKGIEEQKEQLLANTRQFASGYSANNALLWGARGMGKSSLVKAVFSDIEKQYPGKIALIELLREDIGSLSTLISLLRGHARRFIIFIDDLSFDMGDRDYQGLKTVLEGGIEARPANILLYATSNRRHLMAEEALANEQSAIHPHEAVEEKTSLSDRFGLWLGFHSCTEEEYQQMVTAYAESIGVAPEKFPDMAKEAALWSRTRGGRSGRVAWQFILDLAGKQSIRLR